MTVSLPGGHHIETGIDANSRTWVALDGGEPVPSTIASLHKLNMLWLDAVDIPLAWLASTGERLAWHICEGCGVRDARVRIVDGSDEWWCPSCR